MAQPARRAVCSSTIWPDLAAGALALSAALRSSKLGHAFLAIREDAQARALGVDVTRARFYALFISAAMTAVGRLHRLLVEQSFPGADLRMSRSIDIILAPIVGGIGHCSARSSAPSCWCRSAKC